MRPILPANLVARALSPTPADEVLRTEFRTFAHHLLGISVSPALATLYLRQQRELALDAAQGFDALLVRLARRGGIALALADTYAGWFARRSLLRTKLVGALALLETAPESYAAIDAPDARAPWLRLVLRGLAELATLLVATLLLAPVHVLSGRR